MANRFRELVKSLLYAGLKPGAPEGPASPAHRLGALSRLFERVVSSGAESDPLYLTNRTFAERAKRWAWIAVPSVVLAGILLFTLSNRLPRDPAPSTPTSIEIAKKYLPNLSEIKIDSNKDVEVLDAHIDRTAGVRLVGTVRNVTDREIHGTELVFELADREGSEVGTMTVQVAALAAKASASFAAPIESPAAQFVLVDEVRTR